MAKQKNKRFDGDQQEALRRLKSGELEDEANLPGIDWRGKTVIGLSMKANLSGANLSRCKLKVGFPDGDLSGANLENAKCDDFGVDNADFTSANLSGAKIVNASINDTNFTKVEAAGVQIGQTVGVSAIFARANLTDAKFTAVGLTRSNFTGAKLRGATFKECELLEVDFSGADLVNASFVESELAGANFGSAKLAGAKFTRSNYDEKTRWPRGQTPDGAVLIEKKKKAPLRAKSKPAGASPPKRLGSVSSLNASIQMLIADAAVARNYRGIDNAAGDRLEGSDWHALVSVLGGKADCLPRRIGEGEGLALELGVCQGVVGVYYRDGGLILVESFADEEDEADSIASEKRRERAKAAGKLRIESGTLIVATSTENCEKAPKKLAPGKARVFGSDGGSLAIGLEPGAYTLLLEKRNDSERCAYLVPDSKL